MEKGEGPIASSVQEAIETAHVLYMEMLTNM